MTPKASPRLSKGTKRGIMGHVAAVAIAKPKEMSMKPASQLGRREGEGGRESVVRGQVQRKPWMGISGGGSLPSPLPSLPSPSPLQYHDRQQQPYRRQCYAPRLRRPGRPQPTTFPPSRPPALPELQIYQFPQGRAQKDARHVKN